uniref:Calcium voltage-gated channel auxiliary subunit alpha2delta 4 n=1 Tax=Podarcis muralis TaxID=64176 RepID=A0A670JPN5_PODMU
MWRFLNPALHISNPTPCSPARASRSWSPITSRKQQAAHSWLKSWADAFGGDLYYIVTKYSGSLLLQKKYKDVEPTLKIKEVDGLELVKKFSEEMQSMLGRKVEAVERLVEAAEDADLYHEFNSSLDVSHTFIASVCSKFLHTQKHRSRKKGRKIPFLLVTLPPPFLPLQYNDYVHYVESCFKGILVQADRDNREHFKQLVDELQAKGVGTVNKALTESFRILREFRNAGQGGLCNQAIMLITDGAMEDYEYVFEKFNWPDRKVRVFTYLIGREVSFAQNVKWIACNNKGYYTQISTLADVQENVMEYLHVLSRPMVINHDHDIIWTEAYMDSALFASQAQSLLLMTTVAMPVFSKKNETVSMMLSGRYFSYKEGKKLKPKPNYNSVDLSEVEWEDVDETLRTAMINGETGDLSMDVKVPVDKGKRVLFLTNDYFFTDISGTPFSLGVVLSRGHGEYILLGDTSVEEGRICPKELLNHIFGLFLSRIYCITDIDPDHRKLNQLEAVIRFLTGEEADLECDEELVQEVLFDAVVTAPMEAYWTTLALNLSDEAEGGVDMAFMGTRAGLMRSALYVGTEKLSNRKFLTREDKESIFTMDHFPLWYRRAAEHPPGSFIYSIPFEDPSGNSFLLFSLFISLCLQTSKFLGEVDGSVMTQLISMGMFKQVKMYDYQAMCKMPHHHHSGARPLLSVIIFVFGSTSFRFFFPHLICFLHPIFSLSLFFPISAHKHKKHDMLQPCDTEYPVFVYEPAIKETNGIIECGDCQKMFVVQQITNSNLLLLVVDAVCDCSNFPPVLLQPKEVKYIFCTAHNASVKCDRMRSQKLRRRPDTCHAFHPEENAQDCGGAAEISASLALLFLPLGTTAVLLR